MTEHEDLIAEARSFAEASYTFDEDGECPVDHNEQIEKLADALEKVTAERDARVSLEYHDSVVGEAQKQIHKLEAERDAARRRNAELTRSSNEKNNTIDALAAVVEQVREFAESKKRPHVDVAAALLILNAAPQAALDRVKAEALRGVIEDVGDAGLEAYAANEVVSWLSDRADRIEKGESNE